MRCCGQAGFSILSVALFVTPAYSQASASWRDPSSHVVRFVTVEKGVRLEVLDHDLERARAILEEVRAARVKDAEADPYLEEDWRCSKCRSRNVTYVPLSPPMLILTLLLLGLPLMFVKRYKRCADCGHTWPA